MGADIKAAGIHVAADIRTEGWSAGTKKMQDDLAKAKEGTEKTLRELSGRGSELHGLLKVMSGGVVNEIGRQFGEAASKVVEMRDALREGKITQEEMARSVAESLPLVGGFVKGFMGLRELMSDESGEIHEIQEGAKATTQFYDAWVTSIQKSRRELSNLATETANLNRSSSVAFGTPLQKMVAGIQNEYDTKYSDDARKKQIEDRKKKLAKEAADTAEKMDPDIAHKQALIDRNNNRMNTWWGQMRGYSTPENVAKLNAENAGLQKGIDEDNAKKTAAREAINAANPAEDEKFNADKKNFLAQSAAKLEEAGGTYSLGTTGRRGGGGIAFQGNVQGEGISGVLAAARQTSLNTARGAKAAEDLFRFLTATPEKSLP